MTRFARILWGDVIRPLLRRPPYRQVAALCWRAGPEGREVLLVTSRGTGRWILPKGWPKDGVSAADMALKEAWEEAGVRRARVEKKPMGTFRSDKRGENEVPLPVFIDVHAAEVLELADDYPEARQRRRAWFTPAEAALKVTEPGLRELLEGF